MKIRQSQSGQAIAPQTIFMNQRCFQEDCQTKIYWLGQGGAMIHSHQTNIMIDPVLKGFDMPLLYDIPLSIEDIPTLDGLLITHIDNDHFSRATCQDIKNVCLSYHAPNYVADVMNEEGYPTQKHDIHENFFINDIKVTVTKALHNWQNGSQKWQYRYWEEKDYCGYWIETQDGTIWLPGDSRLLDEHLHMPEPDVILFDFADNEWHITLEGAIQLANAYPNSDLICIHWGCVDAPAMTPFNGNPLDLFEHIVHPERIHVLAPGEAYQLIKK